jgi:hypothetical protein
MRPAGEVIIRGYRLVLLLSAHGGRGGRRGWDFITHPLAVEVTSILQKYAMRSCTQCVAVRNAYSYAMRTSEAILSGAVVPSPKCAARDVSVTGLSLASRLQ